MISCTFSEIACPKQVMQPNKTLRILKKVPFSLKISYFALLKALRTHTSWSQKTTTLLQCFLGHACLQHYTWVGPLGYGTTFYQYKIWFTSYKKGVEGKIHLNLKAYSLISNRGHSKNFQNLNFLHLFVAVFQKLCFPKGI